MSFVLEFQAAQKRDAAVDADTVRLRFAADLSC